MSITHPIDSHWNRFNLLKQRGTLVTQDMLKLLLNIGLDVLRMDMGIVSHVAGNDYTIEFCSNRHYTGAKYNLAQMYCDLTLFHSTVVDIANIGQIFSVNPEDDALHIESYIGAPLIVDGQVYGTLCFVRAEPRPEPFSQDDITFIGILAQKVSNTLSDVLQAAS